MLQHSTMKRIDGIDPWHGNGLAGTKVPLQFWLCQALGSQHGDWSFDGTR